MIRSREPRISRYSLILPAKFFKLVGHFFDPDLGQTLQTQFKDCAGLGLGQVIGAIVVGRVGRIIDQCDIGQNVFGWPSDASSSLLRASAASAD